MSPAEAASEQGRSGSRDQGSGHRQSQSTANAASADGAGRIGAAVGLENLEPIFELPPQGAVAAGATAIESRIFETLDEWFGGDATGTAGTDRGQSARGAGKAVAAAWLQSLRGTSSSLGPSANQWNEIRIDLGDDAGSVHIRARRDAADQLIVQVQSTDAQTRAQLNASANSLEDQLRDRYGADVDLSFGSDTNAGADAQSGSGDRRQAPQNAAVRQNSHPTNSPQLRGADRVWVG